MSSASLTVSIKEAEKAVDRLLNYKTEAETLDAKYQHFISEMLMLRAFSIFEDTVAEIAYKLVAGATYLNGTLPVLAVRSKRVLDSRGLLLTHARPRPIDNLKWTKAKFIRDSVDNVLDPSEKFQKNASAHGLVIDEMRKVRNALAHNTTTARSDFRAVVFQTYGANFKISVGAFLTSTRRTSTCNLTRYLVSTKAILRSLASGV